MTSSKQAPNIRLINVSQGDAQTHLSADTGFLVLEKSPIMKKILVPSDFSEQAKHAFNFAVDWASRNKSQIHLLHVIELPVLYDTTLMPALSFEKEYLEDAAGLAKKNFTNLIKKVSDKVSVTWAVDYGNPTSVVLQEIKNKKYDLVVMGTKGATGLKEYFVGSNTEKIVRLSPAPVIAVPASINFSSIKNIIVATALAGNQEAVMTKAKQLQELFKATIHLVYVNTPALFRRDKESLEMIQAIIKKYSLSSEKVSIVNDITEEEGLIQYALQTGRCMVLMVTHGRRGLAHALTGSVAEDVVNHIKFPVYTLHATKGK